MLLTLWEKTFEEYGSTSCLKDFWAFPENSLHKILLLVVAVVNETIIGWNLSLHCIYYTVLSRVVSLHL